MRHMATLGLLFEAMEAQTQTVHTVGFSSNAAKQCIVELDFESSQMRWNLQS